MDDEMIKAEIKTYVGGLGLSVRAENALLRAVFSPYFREIPSFWSLERFIGQARETGFLGLIRHVGCANAREIQAAALLARPHIRHEWEKAARAYRAAWENA